VGRATLLVALTLSLLPPCALAAPPCTACAPHTARGPGQPRPSRKTRPRARVGGHHGAQPAAHRRDAAPGPRPRAGVELGATDITGNKELPKVMYIVPWKHPGADGKVLAPPDTLVDEVLAPVDRDVFRRRVRYFRELASAKTAGARAAVAPHGDRRPP
jgi:hypothetical protein